MFRNKLFAVLWTALFIAGLTGCGGGNVQVSANGAQLTGISVTPADPSIARNTSQQLTATGIYADNTTKDLTAYVTWNSSDTGIATIDNSAGTSLAAALLGSSTSNSGHAYAYGKNSGKTTITATSGGTSGSTTLTVTPATLVSIAVTPANPSIAKGTNQQFMATGTFSDNTTQDLTTQVVWSSSTGVATVNGSGLAVSTTAGSTTISATSGNISGSTTLTVTPAALVSIAVTPVNPSIAAGTHQQFTATGTYTDGTTQNLTTTASWNSSNAGAATISNAAGSQGLAASLAAGSTTITAASGGISGTATLTVTPATLVSIAVTPANPSIAKGTAKQFTATGSYSDGSMQNITTVVAWSSSNTGVATISNAAGSNGLAAASAAGSALITAATGSVSGSTTLTVTPATLVSISVAPANASITAGATQQFTATGTYSDGSTQNITTAVTWSSSNTGAAQISNASGSNGLATGVGAGTATITAASGSVSGTAPLTVTAVISGSTTLSWDAPTTNTDGTPLTDLAGYKIHYGTSSGNYTKMIDVGNVTTYVVSNLVPGTYYFTVTTYDTAGFESSYSNEISKTAQ